MKQTNIIFRATPAQKTAIEEAACNAGLTTSEFIRTRALTHRASFSVGNNEFVTEQADGTLFSTESGCAVTSPLFESAVLSHRQNNYHADCVICQQRADPRTEAERQRDEDSEDYANTINSIRPGGM